MTEVRDLLFEIGTEELPPLALQSLAESLFDSLKKYLLEYKLTFGDGKYFATPRRLAVFLQDLSAKQEDETVELKGPTVKVAFDEEGQPTDACIGFAKCCGIDCRDLERKTFGKEERVVCTITKKGETAQQILPSVITKALKELPVPRMMRWGKGEILFARPVHWVVLLYGSEVVPAEILGKAASNRTFGHKFHHPEHLVITEPKLYEEILEEKGYVIPDFSKRKEITWNSVTEASLNIGKPLENEELLQEITSLVEWPVALLGNFDSHLLHLPKEVLILVMEKQQKYVPLVDDNNKLLSSFIIVSNIESKQPSSVIQGNENVILARFTDAEFFYKLDISYVLEGYIEKLQKTIFQTGLGTLYDKVLRVSDLSVLIAKDLHADLYHAKRAADLSKFDLMTAMVGEFPELQGIMGYYYALEYHEPEEIATAIKEQYLPKSMADEIPGTIIGTCLALADRIDTIVGIFSLKKLPTGDKDPYGLKRSAFGILRIILEKNLDLDLREVILSAIKFYHNLFENYGALILKNYQIPSHDLGENINVVVTYIMDLIMDFVFERLRSWYAAKNVPAKVFNAVLANRPTNIIDFNRRVAAISHFLTLKEADELAIAQKRVNNILQKSPAKLSSAALKVRLLEEDAEIELHKQIEHVDKVVKELYEERSYKRLMAELATLKPAIDNFFDHVMVNVEDEKLRNNRMLLLRQLQKMFNLVADITEL